MPQIAQRLREPAAFALLAFAALATLFHTIDFLFAPGQECIGSVCSGPTFSNRAPGALDELASPLMALVLVATVYLAHVGTQLKQARLISLIALSTAGVAALFGVVALFASFGSDGGGWGKTETFFVGAAQLAVFGVATWFLLGYYQQHAPAQPKSVVGPPPQVQFQQQGQWQQPGQTQPSQPAAQGQWTPAPQQQPQPPQQWGQPQPGQQQPGQPWGAPPAPPVPPQQNFGGGSDSMMTQAIPAVPQPQQQTPPQPQAAPETQQFPPVGNWTSE